jgi:hypothetical protein
VDREVDRAQEALPAYLLEPEAVPAVVMEPAVEMEPGLPKRRRRWIVPVACLVAGGFVGALTLVPDRAAAQDEAAELRKELAETEQTLKNSNRAKEVYRTVWNAERRDRVNLQIRTNEAEAKMEACRAG